jgi:hypothetical protein
VPADEQLESEDDVADALGELVNLVAGRVKARLDGCTRAIRLGLPHHVEGHIEIPSRSEGIATPLRWGPVHAELVVLRCAAP